MKPAIPLHDRRYQYIGAATHATAEEFRARQEARRIAAQGQPANVQPMKRKSK